MVVDLRRIQLIGILLPIHLIDFAYYGNWLILKSKPFSYHHIKWQPGSLFANLKVAPTAFFKVISGEKSENCETESFWIITLWLYKLAFQAQTNFSKANS